MGCWTNIPKEKKKDIIINTKISKDLSSSIIIKEDFSNQPDIMTKDEIKNGKLIETDEPIL